MVVCIGHWPLLGVMVISSGLTVILKIIGFDINPRFEITLVVIRDFKNRRVKVTHTHHNTDV